MMEKDDRVVKTKDYKRNKDQIQVKSNWKQYCCLFPVDVKTS